MGASKSSPTEFATRLSGSGERRARHTLHHTTLLRSPSERMASSL